ncbi:Acyl-CoA dehydrogenase, short-chain specific (EC 1.3.99.2) (plasmid) [Mycetohabitans rhizoxinica HKI 454]|uniref:Acyl-CoA dehydrogenase, short-chain specific n=1 Tax=Mycetohabitans rhizoxinica (strain DSM 19002 / CIP 109453 / HKI 454) TaxID=882378 RepID=E5AU90_MYCRK|nr:Acyl-CoA dehydrogenase, short-chain specific (EC 1.3.99.2) [Mycetohabitans rhizoxinica HKI 454]
MKVLDKGRLHIAAICVGAAQRMLDDALRYAMQREQFGQPIAEFQLIQAMLADSQAEIYAARSMVLDTARRRDNNEDVSMEASCCKLFASEMCGRVADRAVQIHGGAGYVSEYAIERFCRDVRLFRNLALRSAGMICSAGRSKSVSNIAARHTRAFRQAGSPTGWHAQRRSG